jgi:hypothetical protein
MGQVEALFFTALGRYFERVSNELDVGDAEARVQTRGSPSTQSGRPKVSGLALEVCNPPILKLSCWRLQPGLHSTGLASAVSSRFACLRPSFVLRSVPPPEAPFDLRTAGQQPRCGCVLCAQFIASPVLLVSDSDQPLRWAGSSRVREEAAVAGVAG